MAVLALPLATPAAELSLASCAPPAYPAEALRYEMEGIARLEFGLDGEGRAVKAHIVQSTGYVVLDRASLLLLASCRFPVLANGGAATASLAVPWKLPAGTRAEVQPELVEESCVRGYKVIQLVRPDSTERNLMIRVQVWPDGQPYSAKVEQSSGEAQADREAIDMVEHCRFRPATRAGQPVQSASLVSLALDLAAISDEQVRALYDRLVTAMAKEQDFKVRHILLTTESVARSVLADLKGGAEFGAIARQQSIDKPSGKVDGELGWLRPTDTAPEFSAALAKHGILGLLPAPVRTPFGWHVIEIEAARPSVVPPFDNEAKRILKQKLIGEKEIVVQSPPAR